jgi:hypothetical protein
MPRVGSISGNKERDELHTRLERAYDTGQSAYTLTLQLVAFSLAGVAALTTLGFESKSPLPLLIAGPGLFLLVGHLARAGRAMTAILIIARSLEKQLYPKSQPSIVAAIYGSIESPERFAELDRIITKPQPSPDALMLAQAERLSMFRGRTTNTLTYALGAILIAFGVYYAITPS